LISAVIKRLKRTSPLDKKNCSAIKQRLAVALEQKFDLSNI
jgi:hypothetical protein